MSQTTTRPAGHHLQWATKNNKIWPNLWVKGGAKLKLSSTDNRQPTNILYSTFGKAKGGAFWRCRIFDIRHSTRQWGAKPFCRLDDRQQTTNYNTPEEK